MLSDTLESNLKNTSRHADISRRQNESLKTHVWMKIRLLADLKLFRECLIFMQGRKFDIFDVSKIVITFMCHYFLK